MDEAGGKVLLVDDDPKMLRLVAYELGREGIGTTTASTGQEALRRLAEGPPAAVVLDLLLPDIPGKDLLARIGREHPGLPVVMLTVQDSVDAVVDCMKLGAVDYVHKPFEATRLLTSVRNALARGTLQARVETLTRELRRGEGFGAILGESPAVRKMIELLRRAAASEVSLLLEGDSGTGKEVAARAVHAEGPRRSGPFVAVNCGAIPEGLIESELFGHEKGSFTGAIAARRGCFEQADGGSIFLDEIGELRLDLQVRLLRVLQEHRVQRVGGAAERSVDVRVVAATNKDLRAMIPKREFREDLYYRLAVFPVRLPPLREREGDVMLLAGAFQERFAARHRRAIEGFSDDARRALESYSWPGNVRELENVVERATILEDGDRISLGSLPDEVVDALHGETGGVAPPPREAPAAESPPGARPVLPLEEEERRILRNALEVTGWNIQEAASRLGISRATVYRKIERFGFQQGGAAPAGKAGQG